MLLENVMEQTVYLECIYEAGKIIWLYTLQLS